MPYELNAREVLFYLNELGYTNITAQQLKDFMIDLKKLVKYDDRCHDQDDSDSAQLQQRDIFEELYNTDTVASRAKSVKPRTKESVITVQINRPKSANDEPVCNKSTKSNSLPTSVRVNNAKSNSLPTSVRESSVVRVDNEHTSAPSLVETQECHTCSTARTTDTKKSKRKIRPKTSFIRPRLNTKPPKSDPVALYHQYQEEWKKQKIPGTTNHPQVRWCIREKLMGDKFDYCY